MCNVVEDRTIGMDGEAIQVAGRQTEETRIYVFQKETEYKPMVSTAAVRKGNPSKPKGRQMTANAKHNALRHWSSFAHGNAKAQVKAEPPPV